MESGCAFVGVDVGDSGEAFSMGPGKEELGRMAEAVCGIGCLLVGEMNGDGSRAAMHDRVR